MFRVEWSDSALIDDLCQLYVDHPARRTDITYASHRVEQMLTVSANVLGTEISPEGLRKLQYSPLELVFSVDGNEVEIEKVRWIDN